MVGTARVARIRRTGNSGRPPWSCRRDRKRRRIRTVSIRSGPSESGPGTVRSEPTPAPVIHTTQRSSPRGATPEGMRQQWPPPCPETFHFPDTEPARSASRHSFFVSGTSRRSPRRPSGPTWTRHRPAGTTRPADDVIQTCCQLSTQTGRAQKHSTRARNFHASASTDLVTPPWLRPAQARAGHTRREGTVAPSSSPVEHSVDHPGMNIAHPYG